MNNRSCTVVAAAAALSAVVAGGLGRAAHADLVFGNFDETTQFTQSWYAFQSGNPGAEFERAIPFIVTGGDFLLDSIVIPVYAMPGNPNQPPVFGTSAFFSLYADDGDGLGGLPGDLLESTAVTSDLQYVTSVPPFPPPITISFSGTTLLQEGRIYWIGAAEAGNTAMAWQVSPADGFSVSVLRNLADPDNWLSGPAGISFGLQVHGTLVPAPSALAALMLPLLCAGRRRRH